MCGIAGVLNIKDGPEVSKETLNRMISVLKHRGPDEFGIYRDDRVGLGHARLSIIDLATGQQPMSNEDGSVWITFNGEIFNYVELREDLIKKGHRFKTTSDTEVIVHLYEDYGRQCLDYLNGQFAFALWDTRKKELFAARDRLGIRPLFYAMHSGRFYFASEIKAIFATGELPREIDPEALNQIFSFWHTIPPTTPFKGVNELPPGYCLTLKNGNIKLEQYWDVAYSDKPDDISFEDATLQLEELLIDSTRLQLRADVPVGAYLSGGLDSSVTTAFIRNFSSSRLKTFSISFEDKTFDESVYQQEMSKALGTEHSVIRCSYSDIGSSFPDVIWHTEKPVLRTAPTPLFLLSKLVRENDFKVVLTGEGADEIAGGYDIFKEAKIRQFWARFPDSKLRPLLLKKLYPYLPAFQKQSGAYMRSFFNESLSDTTDEFFSHRPRWLTTSKSKLFFSADLKARLNGVPPENRLMSTMPARFGDWPPLARAQYLETKNLLPGYILSSQGDRMSMAHSIEGRVPFLDHRVVEFFARLPFHYKMRGLNEKYILKKCVKRYLPKGIVKRTKQPYMAPDSKSFFQGGKGMDYVEELLSEERISEYGYFNPKPVKLLVNKCRKDAIVGFKDNMAVVGILSTQLLHQRFIKDFPGSIEMVKDVNEVNQPAT